MRTAALLAAAALAACSAEPPAKGVLVTVAPAATSVDAGGELRAEVSVVNRSGRPLVLESSQLPGVEGFESVSPCFELKRPFAPPFKEESRGRLLRPGERLERSLTFRARPSCAGTASLSVRFCALPVCGESESAAIAIQDRRID